LIVGGVAAGAVAAGAVGRSVRRRRVDHDLEAPLWDLPPDDLGPVSSFDGTRLAVRAAGDPGAPMLLFVHGFSLDMTTWREQWVDLSLDHRCVLMDQRGHGASEQPVDRDLSVRSMGRDIAAVPRRRWRNTGSDDRPNGSRRFGNLVRPRRPLAARPAVGSAAARPRLPRKAPHASPAPGSTALR
jgi:hypothetical protein